MNNTQRTTIRLRKSVHKSLKFLAIERGSSIQELLETAAEQIVAKAEKAAR